MAEHSMKSKHCMSRWLGSPRGSRTAADLGTENVLEQLSCSGAPPFQYRQGAAGASWVCLLSAGRSSLLSSSGRAWGAAGGAADIDLGILLEILSPLLHRKHFPQASGLQWSRILSPPNLSSPCDLMTFRTRLSMPV